MDTVIERLGATVAKNLPVKLGSSTNAEQLRGEWEYQLTGQLPGATTTKSWWESLLESAESYLLESEKIKAQKAAAEAKVKTEEYVPPEKTWLEKNWWVVPAGLISAVLLTVAAVK